MDVVTLGLQLGMIVLVAFSILRWGRLVSTAARCWRRGRGFRAMRLVAGDPMLGAYLTFAALVILVYLASAVASAQGRQWFPFLPVIVWMAVDYAPRALPSATAVRRLRAAVLAALLLYGGLATPAAMRAIELRYYGQTATGGPSVP
jgi:hypothetical protein